MNNMKLHLCQTYLLYNNSFIQISNHLTHPKKNIKYIICRNKTKYTSDTIKKISYTLKNFTLAISK